LVQFFDIHMHQLITPVHKTKKRAIRRSLFLRLGEVIPYNNERTQYLVLH
jgi:hypothetical protein